MSNYLITTDRLGLRGWEESDLELAYKMCSNERVMEFFPRCLTLHENKNFIDRMKTHHNQYGFCYFAVDRLDTNSFIGFIGLMHQTYETGFDPFIDLGWRLLPEAWGKGFASEGAQACVDFAFSKLDLPQLFAIAPKLNKKSQRVMQKIGMQEYTHFKHPKIEESNPLSKCVAYKIKKSHL